MSSDVRLRPDQLTWRRIGDEIVVLDLKTQRYLAVNPTGARLWDLLVDGCERTTLADRLVDEYDVGVDRAYADVDSLLASLGANGLLEPIGASG